ncbi:hypothetical protein Csa_018983 [Cucumis sativus]|uniref:Uncharacterized protein n=1 Tax=Cucumis sativus TaxID=3659 RepID=A0A0A0KFG4_CUCSA|nr:hypothetical protein Csa_018983 [Cucumis sativus]
MRFETEESRRRQRRRDGEETKRWRRVEEDTKKMVEVKPILFPFELVSPSPSPPPSPPPSPRFHNNKLHTQMEFSRR